MILKFRWIICHYEVSVLYYVLFHRIYYRFAHIIRLHTLIEHTYSLVVNKLNPSIMNFKIKSKLAETWNPVLLTIYETLPYPFNEIIWKLEQLRTPKVFYYDLEDGVKLVKVR